MSAAAVQINNISVLNPVAPFNTPISLEITFTAFQALQDDLEWRLTYVGSANSEEFDQRLDTILVGPVTAGGNKFILECPPADLNKIPPEEILGITVMFLECLYKNKAFVRVGYYVATEFADQQLQQQLLAATTPQGISTEDDSMDIEQSGDDDEEEDEGEEMDDSNNEENELMELDQVENGQNTNVSGGSSNSTTSTVVTKPTQTVAPPQPPPSVVAATTTAPPPPPPQPTMVLDYSKLDPSRITRTIVHDKPRVTQFAIDWDNISSPTMSPDKNASQQDALL